MHPAVSCDRLRTPSPARTVTLGEWRFTHLPDGFVQLRPAGWFVGLGERELAGLHPYLDADGCLVGSIGGLLIEHRDLRVLIDAGFGPRRLPATQSHPALGVLQGGELADALTAAGLRHRDIDVLGFTHLHDDHVGWTLVQDGGLFGDARVVVDRQELQVHAQALPERLRRRAVTPAPGEQPVPGLEILPLPGHTAGHTGFRVDTGDGRLLILGDAFHSPAQIARPDWRVLFDADHARARETRTRLLAEASRQDTVCYAGHFADVVFGRVVGQGDEYAWQSAA